MLSNNYGATIVSLVALAAVVVTGDTCPRGGEGYCSELSLETLVLAIRNGKTPEEQERSLRRLALQLRDGDERLVRPSPQGSTASLQAKAVESGLIETAARALELGTWSARASGAEVVHLLTTNNPANRDALGDVGVIPLLIPLLRAGLSEEEDGVRACEEAGEALWILAFAGGANSGANHHREHGLHAPEISDALADVVLWGKSRKAKMWAAAAFGNLVAAYSSVPSHISQATRRRILANHELVAELVRMASLGPVGPDVPRDRWAGSAAYTQRQAHEILPWAALHALKSIALSSFSHEQLVDAGAADAGRQNLGSPDWLENMKSHLLLQNLGML